MGWHGFRFGVIWTAAAAVLLAGCSSGAASDAPAGASSPPAVGTSVAPSSASALDPVAAEAAAFDALPASEQENRIAAESAAAELALLPESDAAAYNAMTAALITQARAYASDPTYGKFGAGPVMTEEGGFGGMTFAGWVVSGMGVSAAVNATNGAKAGEAPQSETKKDSSNSGTSEFTVAGSVESASVDWTMTSTQKGMTGSLRLRGSVNPCPDVNGEFTAKVTLDTTGASDSGGGSMASTVDIALDGLVDDTAAIIGYETTTNTRAKSGTRGQVADVTTTTTHGAGDVTAASRSDNAASDGTTLDGQQWGNLGMMTESMIVKGLVDSIRQAIESGRCVKLNAPTTPSKTKGLKPSTAVSISAQPRSKIDGKPTGGTVTGKLNGGSSLDPAGAPVNADATFNYVAPDQEDERATVSLESRSIRGVGKAEVPFDTVVMRGYTIGQRIAPYHFTAVNCGNASGPWVITYELEGMPKLKGGGVIKLTFPSEPPPGDEDTIVSTVGTDKGELKAVGLPAGVRFGGPAKATMQRYGIHLKLTVTTSGMATGYAMGKQKSAQENSATIELVATAASATACPTPTS